MLQVASRKGGHSSGTAAAAAGCVEWEWVEMTIGGFTGGGVIEKQGNTRLAAVACSLRLEAFAVWRVACAKCVSCHHCRRQLCA